MLNIAQQIQALQSMVATAKKRKGSDLSDFEPEYEEPPPKKKKKKHGPKKKKKTTPKKVSTDDGETPKKRKRRKQSLGKSCWIFPKNLKHSCSYTPRPFHGKPT